MLQAAFIIITILSLLLLFYATGKDRKFLIIELVWIAVVGVVSLTGYFMDISSTPPRIVLVLFPAFCFTILAFKKLRQSKTDIRYLIAIHCLRLPVEIVLYQLYLQKLVPVEMTFEGLNFYIAMGISECMLLAVQLYIKRGLNSGFLLAWNLLGLCLLTIIVAVAIFSSPMPLQQFGFGQPNVAVLQFPFILLPACIVPVVYLSHLLMLNHHCTGPAVSKEGL